MSSLPSSYLTTEIINFQARDTVLASLSLRPTVKMHFFSYYTLFSTNSLQTPRQTLQFAYENMRSSSRKAPQPSCKRMCSTASNFTLRIAHIVSLASVCWLSIIDIRDKRFAIKNTYSWNNYLIYETHQNQLICAKKLFEHNLKDRIS